jgi:hypothetical protein
MHLRVHQTTECLADKESNGITIPIPICPPGWPLFLGTVDGVNLKVLAQK